MAIRGCTSYVFYSGQILGSSNHANFYFGRNKKTGEDCAVSVYKDMAINIVKNSTEEIKELYKIKHNNILKLYTELDHESKSKELLIVFEYCSEKSLKDMLKAPENIFGLEMKAFCNLVIHMVQAIDHLQSLDSYAKYQCYFTPTNVLCHKTSSKDYIFKLSNFFFKPLITENLKEKDPYALLTISVLRSDVMLLQWSYGSLLFHAATGLLPFQGDNKNQIAHCLRAKDNGSICYIHDQATNRYNYSSHLPFSNTLSAAGTISEVAVDVIRRTIGDLDAQYSWSDISRKMTDLSNMLFLRLMDATTGEVHDLAVPKEIEDLDVEGQIKKIFNVEEAMQIIISPANPDSVFSAKRKLVDGKMLARKPATPIHILRPHMRYFGAPYTRPLVIWCLNYKARHLAKLEAAMPDLSSVPMPPHQTEAKKLNLVDDLEWGRRVGAYIYRLGSILHECIEVQTALVEVRKFATRAFLRMVEDGRRVLQVLKLVNGLLNPDSAKKVKHINELFSSNDIDKEVSAFIGRTNPLPRLCADYSCGLFLASSCDKSNLIIEKFKKEVDSTKKAPSNAGGSAAMGESAAKMTYNEEQMHRYDKYKLKELLDAANKRVLACIKRSEDEYAVARDFFKSVAASDFTLHCDQIGEIFDYLESNYDSLDGTLSYESGYSSCPSTLPSSTPSWFAAKGPTKVAIMTVFDKYASNANLLDSIKANLEGLKRDLDMLTAYTERS